MTAAIPVRRRVPVPAIGLLVYAGLLQYAYAVELVPDFAYNGYRYEAPNWWAYAVGLALAIGLTALLPKRIERPSQTILWLFYVIAGVPSMLIPHYSAIVDVDQALLMDVFIALSFGATILLAGRSTRLTGTLPQIRLPDGTVWLLIGAISLAIYVYIFFVAGLGVHLVALSDVYDLRSDFRDEATASAALGYVLRIQANVLNPLILARGIVRRNWTLVAVGIVGEVLLYAASGFKTILFAAPAVAAVAVWLAPERRRTGRALVAGMAAGVTAIVLIDWLTDNVIWSSLFIRRFLVTPGRLSTQYVDAWSDRPHLLMSNSVLSPFFDYPYELPPSRLMGLILSGNPEQSANANPFAVGFMNFGWAGMFVECAFIVLLLWLIDEVSDGIPVVASSLVFVMPTIALTNATVFTTALTHGFLAGVLVMMVMPRGGWLLPVGREPEVGRAQTGAGEQHHGVQPVHQHGGHEQQG